MNIAEANKAISKRIQQTAPARERLRRGNKNPSIQDMGSTVIVSMDVCALYPSISINLASKTMIKVIKESKLSWERVNQTILERYLAISVDSEVLRKHKLLDCLPTAKSRTSLQSWLSPTGTAKQTNGESQFHPKVREPSDSEVRTMIAIAVAHTVSICMSNIIKLLEEESKDKGMVVRLAAT